MKLAKLATAMFVWSCLQPWPTLACRYNVRDVGFVDLGGEPYVLYAFVRHDTPKELVTQFKDLSSAVLADSNIASEIINIEEQKDHVALKYLPAEASFPGGILVSPDGQSLPLTIGKSSQAFRESLVAALDDLLSSPKRDEIVQQVIKNYAAILLIEGPSTEENGRARKAIAEAIEQIRGQLKGLPKAIFHPPSLVVLDAASFARERVLLWSLGLEPDKISDTRAAVIFGKVRWIGPLMKGQEINEGNLGRLLSIIGADCECGLDISWTQGTRLPVRWDEKLSAQVAKALDFDPENPLVKIEVSRIIGRRGSGAAASVSDANTKQPGSTAIETAAMTNSTKTSSAANRSGGLKTTQPVLADHALVLHRSLIMMTSLTVVALSAGLWLFFRAANKRRRE